MYIDSNWACTMQVTLSGSDKRFCELNRFYEPFICWMHGLSRDRRAKAIAQSKMYCTHTGDSAGMISMTITDTDCICFSNLPCHATQMACAANIHHLIHKMTYDTGKRWQCKCMILYWELLGFQMEVGAAKDGWHSEKHPVLTSINIVDNDQISLATEQVPFKICSGAIQVNVPIWVAVFVGPLTSLPRPKSAILTCLSEVRSRFGDLRSRCATPCSCKQERPAVTAIMACFPLQTLIWSVVCSCPVSCSLLQRHSFPLLQYHTCRLSLCYFQAASVLDLSHMAKWLDACFAACLRKPGLTASHMCWRIQQTAMLLQKMKRYHQWSPVVPLEFIALTQSIVEGSTTKQLHA